MILEKELPILITGRNKTYYINKGYDCVLNEYLPIKNEDVNPNSHLMEKRICDKCGTTYVKTHQGHCKTLNIFGVDVCQKCGHKNEETLNKRRKTCLSKYGEDNVLKVQEIKEKASASCLKNFGVKNPMQNEEIYNKAISTCIEKYGDTFRQKNCEKAQNTLLERYGYNNPSLCEEFVIKRQKTCLDKYGYNNVLLIPEIKEKIKVTNLEKYGCENPLSSHDIRRKCAKTLHSSGKIATSSQQKTIFDMIVKNFPENQVELNYVIDNYFLDICILDFKLNIEYDGNYWHSFTEEKDRKRDDLLLSYGYNIIRIKSDRKIPEESYIINYIKIILQNDSAEKQVFTIEL